MVSGTESQWDNAAGMAITGFLEDNGSMVRFGKLHPAYGIAVACFLVFLSVGFLVFRDYGVGIDEYSQRDLGRLNYEYVTRGNRELLGSYDRYYGPAFEVVLTALSPLVGRFTHADATGSRHLIEFVFFAGAVVCWYLLLGRITGSPWYGLVGAFALVLSPRMFAESFYNSKDMALVSAGIYLLYSLWYFLDGSAIWTLVHAVLSGYALAIRPQALILVIASITARIMYKKKAWRSVAWYGALSVFFAWMFFPVFWEHPFAGLSGFWLRMAEPVGVPTYFFGAFYISPDIPWYRLLVWIAVTTPISVVAGTVLGLGWYIRQGLRRVYHSKPQAMYAAMGVVVLGTFGLAIVMRARTYDGWRHIYYIYPSCIGFFVYFVSRARASPVLKTQSGRLAAWIVSVAILLDGLLLVRFMVRNHPNQYVYFNAFAGGYARAKRNFDFDYWGISLRQVRAFLLSLPGDGARVYIEEADYFPYVEKELKPALLARGFRFTGTSDAANVYVTTQRNNKMPPPQRFSRIYGVSVEGTDLSTVYADGPYRELLNTKGFYRTLPPQ